MKTLELLQSWVSRMSARQRFLSGAAMRRIASLGLGLALIRSALAAPYLPQDDNQVLEWLPRGSGGKQARELRSLRYHEKPGPNDLAAVIQLARHCIEQSRTQADPRFLGYAQAALGSWWNQPTPPAEVLVLRATIKQSRHDFTAALADLDLAVKANPADAQVWLTRATILQVRGDYAGAKRALLPLLRLAPGLVSTSCAASLASMTGHAAQGCDLLRQVLSRDHDAAPQVRQWALTVLGETHARLGHPQDAETAFRAALAIAPNDPYLLGAYADFLLDQQRPREVRELLAGLTRVDGLLLRLALAEQNDPVTLTTLRQHVELLKARFDACAARGQVTHRREEARFALTLLNEPRRALSLAKANWDVQREPADARILLEAAQAAGEPAAARPVLAWMQKNQIEDVHLALLAKATDLEP